MILYYDFISSTSFLCICLIYIGIMHYDVHMMMCKGKTLDLSKDLHLAENICVFLFIQTIDVLQVMKTWSSKQLQCHEKSILI